jgi:hypothetical protein
VLVSIRLFSFINCFCSVKCSEPSNVVTFKSLTAKPAILVILYLDCVNVFTLKVIQNIIYFADLKLTKELCDVIVILAILQLWTSRLERTDYFFN